MSLWSEARSEAVLRMMLAREQIGLTLQESTRFEEGFVEGVEWLAARLLSAEAVERVAQAKLDSERARHYLPPVPLDTLRNAEEWIEDARAGLTATLGEES